mmetsp:Transcript_145134/g.252040  ORF Transcript_145134/g.252040 Transcript_145134/m.252040 type:complete len:85 (+) Transcript_145134:121-375(+)
MPAISRPAILFLSGSFLLSLQKFWEGAVLEFKLVYISPEHESPCPFQFFATNCTVYSAHHDCLKIVSFRAKAGIRCTNGKLTAR